MKRMKQHFILLFLTLTFLMIWNQNVCAEMSEWRFELTPYVYVPLSVDIDTGTVNSRTTSANPGVGDIIDLIDFAGMARFEAWKGRWGFIIDAMYEDLGADGIFQTRLGPIISADVDYKQANVDFGVSRRFDMLTGGKKIPWWIDPIVGVRYVYLKQEIDLKLSFPRLAVLGEPNRTLGGDEDWIEPFVGCRIGWQLTDKLIFAVRWDIGGFGIGDASDLTWNLLAGIDYKPWESVSLKFGYRIYDIDYETDNPSDKFGLDAQLQGPVLGVTFYF